MKDNFTFVCGNAVKTVTLDCEESAVMEEAGKMLLDADIPGELEISSEKSGRAGFSIGKRGTYVKGGVKQPSMYVTCDYYNLDLDGSLYADAYLTCVNLESNNYKYYWLRPNNAAGETTSIGATYGRIGSERGEAFGTKDLQDPYESYLYWIRYYEKLSKGYVDQTNIYLNTAAGESSETDEVKTESASKSDVPSQELYKILLAYAKGVVETNLTNQTVTVQQVEQGRKIWSTLGSSKTVDEFNDTLSKLFALSPRKCRYVTELLAQSPKDYAKIIDREEALLNAMAVIAKVDISGKAHTGSFKDFGVKVYVATEKQQEKVLGKLPDDLKQKVKRIYRVIPEAQKKRFNTYLKAKGIKRVKELWHGSRNENWLNIMKTSLSLNPNAVITGKMLGNGIYFAPSATKSWGYTSYSGSYWAKGHSNTAFMGLFATAYGDPYTPTTNRHYTQSELDAVHKNCVHAKAGLMLTYGGQLKNEEIVFYDEKAMLLNYIVEFAA